MRSLLPTAMFGLVLALSFTVLAQESSSTTQTAPAPPAQTTSKVPDGINDNFKDPDLEVEKWLLRFEVESREVYSARDDVLKACAIQPGERIADVGAGTGFYSLRFAKTTGEDGWVYSVDIAPKFLQHIAIEAADHGITNLTTVLGTDDSICLPPESVDLVFICDTYHHFESPPESLASILRALKPGGRLVLIDFERIPGKTREFLMGHVRAGKEVFKNEVIQAGFEFTDEVKVDAFKENYLLRFTKPAQPAYPTGKLGDAVRLGEALVQQTGEHPLTKPFVGNSLNCTSCHLDAGRHSQAASFIGVASAYPAYSPREQSVITLEDRILNCFIRSQNGTRPANGSEVPVAIAAYITWLSEDTQLKMNPAKPLGPNHIPMLADPPVKPNIERGKSLYQNRCSACHAVDGIGTEEGPPVWGEDSFNDGAGLSQIQKMASWLKVAMPLDETDLTDQEAFDLAAFVNSHARPKFPASPAQ